MAPRKLKRKTLRRKKRSRSRRTYRQRGGAEKPILFKLTDAAGFCSVFFFICKAYMQAKKKGVELFIEDGGWNYTYKDGWQDWFTTLKPFTDKDMDVERVHHTNVPGEEYTANEYTNTMKELFKPKQYLIDKAEEFIRTIPGDFTALYVRRGDKTNGSLKEMSTMSVEEILKNSDLMNVERLFVQTDDYGVVEEVKKLLPNAKVFTLTEESMRGSDAVKTRKFSADEKKKNAEQFFVELLVFQRAKAGWTDHRSNVGRFQKLWNFDTVNNYAKGENDISDKNKVVKPWESM